MTTNLIRFTQMARDNPTMTFTSLLGMVFDADGLLDSFNRQPARKASGADGMRKDAYAVGVEGRLTDLSARLRRLGYHPKPALRKYIAKANGGMRPLGIPSFEDRIRPGSAQSDPPGDLGTGIPGLLLWLSAQPRSA